MLKIFIERKFTISLIFGILIGSIGTGMAVMPVPTAIDHASLMPTIIPTIIPTIMPTVLPTAMPMPTAMSNSHSENLMSDMSWHSPGAHGDRPAHEHGDAPPKWVINSDYAPAFDHAGNTPNENMAYWKHTGFKGWLGEFKGVKWYGVFHLDFNPAGHVNRFHSYQMWLQDPAGAVSHMHGWLDFGSDNGTGPNLRIICKDQTDIRPIMMVNGGLCEPKFETWYGKGGSEWTPDIGFSISPNYYAGGDITNPKTWKSINSKVNNVERRIEISWYTFRSSKRGEFYATQFGKIVSGPSDPVCGTEQSFGDKKYKVLCLKQYIAPSLTQISHPENYVQTRFPGNNLQLPN